MYKFNTLGAEPKQKITMLLSDNSEVIFNFEYKANQLGWFFTFEYNGNTYGKFRLTTNYNILSAYSSYLPFGLRCDTSDNEEPYNIDDFSSGYAVLYLLTSTDVGLVEQKYYTRSEVENV